MPLLIATSGEDASVLNNVTCTISIPLNTAQCRLQLLIFFHAPTVFNVSVTVMLGLMMEAQILQ